MNWGKLNKRRLISLASQSKTASYISENLGCTEQDVIDKCVEINLELYGFAKPAQSRKGEAMRECLKCHSDFLSSDSGNRICSGCVSTVNSARCSFESHYLRA